jgi:hypothetical protein
MQKRTGLTFFLLSAAAGFILSCSGTDSSPVGLDFLQRANIGTEARRVFNASPGDTTFKNTVSTLSSTYLYFGHYGAVEARTLVLFDTMTVSGIPDSLVLVFDTPVVVAEKDGSGSIRIHVHAVTGDWSGETITWDTFDPGWIGTEIAAKSVLTAGITDSTETLRIQLPVEWAAGLIDPMARTVPHGLLVSADEADGIILVHSGEVTDANGASVGATLMVYAGGDSSAVSYLNDAFIASAALPSPSDRLFAVSGVSMRSWFRFPVSGIPENATINRAFLTLHNDASFSFPPVESPMYLYLYNVTDSVWTAPDVPLDSTYYISSSSTPADTTTRVFNITTIVQLWVAKLLDNNGLALTGMKETSDITGTAFYGSRADSLLRPSLEVFYTSPPDAVR